MYCCALPPPLLALNSSERTIEVDHAAVVCRRCGRRKGRPGDVSVHPDLYLEFRYKKDCAGALLQAARGGAGGAREFALVFVAVCKDRLLASNADIDSESVPHLGQPKTQFPSPLEAAPGPALVPSRVSAPLQ